MTAISGAILELEAFRERLARQIASLRCLERTIEHADQVASDVFGPIIDAEQRGVPQPLLKPGSGAGSPGATPEAPVRATPRPPVTKPTTARPPAAAVPSRAGAPPPGKGSAAAEQILAYLQRQIAVSSRAEIASAMKRPVGKIAWPLKQLVRSGRVIATGRTFSRRYAAAKASARTGIKSDESAFEVAWNGSKERKGEAPSLLGDRARKAS
jgi:hypothetical protein